MKLTLTNIKDIKQKSDNKLTKDVCNYVIEKWHEYDDKKNIFTDVLHYGCQSGIVSKLIYYSDTTKYFKKFKNEINQLLCETIASTGLSSMKDLFGKNFDEEDPLFMDCYNQNLMAWFGFEETLRNIGLQFEVLENYI